MNTLRDYKYIVAVDINAKSPVWFHENEDNRDRLLVDLMHEHDCISLNTSGIPTFFTTRARGWTDICLTPTTVGSIIENCETLSTTSASDHRYVLTTVSKAQHHNTTSDKSNKFSKRITNWDSYRLHFAENWRTYHYKDMRNKEDIDKYADYITVSMAKALQLSTSNRARNQYHTHWWTDELEGDKHKIRKRIN
ncbi:uncharacterized protein LOC111620685 [Centruroides sculpturatus]|uniref:uncharacterized protein LOC111620685 n=1 Tax=Centruroides sculpturatus TaxID=218467 RepID=UPI000C6CB611|nr:uncharacterized protein LOC111620685 [Centruroides sculpturatus]